MTRSPRILTLTISAALAIYAVVAYEQVRLNGFVYDDGMYLTRNPHVQVGLTPESVAWAFTTGHMGSWHPVTWLSHLSDVTLFGLNASWHHLVNLLLHIVNVVLLFRLLTTMTGAVWTSAFLAAVFAVHPLRVESVAWIAERKDVLSGTFWILTMIAYVRYVKRPAVTHYLMVVLYFGLGLMAKPMLVTLPLVLLLLDYWPLYRIHSVVPAGNAVSPNNRQRSLGYLIMEKIPLFVLAAVFAAVTFAVQRGQGAMTMMESGRLSLSVRAWNAAISYVTYIFKTLYPAGLAAFYPHPGENISIIKAAGALLLLVTITVAVIYAGRKGRRYLTVGWLWFVGTLVPVIGLVQVGEQALADRYMYLPSIGLLIMIAFGARDLFTGRRGSERGVAVAAAIVLVVLAVATRAQVAHWRNSYTLYSHAIAVTDGNYVAYYNLARAEILDGRMEEGIDHLRQMLKIRPDHAEALSNLGVALSSQGRYVEATPYFEDAVKLKPDDARMHNNLGQALGLDGRYDEAKEHFQEALRLLPDFGKAYYNLGFIYFTEGNDDEALRLIDKALSLNPNLTDAVKLRNLILDRRKLIK
jgi:tetratricopeptide (TPR) repeat protein